MKYMLLVIFLTIIIIFFRETVDFFKTQVILNSSSDASYQQTATLPNFWEKARIKFSTCTNELPIFFLILKNYMRTSKHKTKYYIQLPKNCINTSAVLFKLI